MRWFFIYTAIQILLLLVVSVVFVINVRANLNVQMDERQIAAAVWSEYKYLGKSSILFAAYSIKEEKFILFQTDGDTVTQVAQVEKFNKDEHYFDVVSGVFKRIDSLKLKTSVVDDYLTVSSGIYYKMFQLYGLNYDVEKKRIETSKTCIKGEKFGVTMQDYKQYYKLPSTLNNQDSYHDLLYFLCGDDNKKTLKVCSDSTKFNLMTKACEPIPKIRPRLYMATSSKNVLKQKQFGFETSLVCENGVNRAGTRCNDSRCKVLDGINYEYSSARNFTENRLYSSAYLCVDGGITKQVHCDSSQKTRKVYGFGVNESQFVYIHYPKQYATSSLSCKDVEESDLKSIAYPFEVLEYRALKRGLMIKFVDDKQALYQSDEYDACLFSSVSFMVDGKSVESTKPSVMYKDKLYEAKLYLPSFSRSTTFEPTVVMLNGNYYYTIGRTCIDALIRTETNNKKAQVERMICDMLKTIDDDFEHIPLPLNPQLTIDFEKNNYVYYNTANLYGINATDCISHEQSEKLIQLHSEKWKIDIKGRIKYFKSLG